MNFTTVNRDNTNNFFILEHGDDYERSRASKFYKGYSVGIALFVWVVFHLIDDLECAPAGRDARSRHKWVRIG